MPSLARRLVATSAACMALGMLACREPRGHDANGEAASPPTPSASSPSGTAAVLASATSSSTSPPPVTAGAAELRLVAPLAPGGDLAGFTVREIRGVDHGLMRVVCAKDKAVVRLDVALADPEGALPPATAGRYAIFYALHGASPEDGEALAKRLAHVIEANTSAPPPPGMTTFTPKPRPATVL